MVRPRLLQSRTILSAAVFAAAVIGRPASADADLQYQMTDLGTLGGTYSGGYAINASGQVAGLSYTTGGDYHAFLYTGTPGSGGTMADLGTLGGLYSYGYTINAGGQVAGTSDTASGQLHTFLYTGTPGSGGRMIDLGTLVGGRSSYGYAVNDGGQVAGASLTDDYHAFLYSGTPGSGGAMADLGTLGGTGSYGYAINAIGQVAGDSYTAGDLAQHAFLYSGTPGSGGAMADLGTLGSGSLSIARGINDSGQIVGYSYTVGSDSNTSHAFLYTAGQMQDLNDLVTNGTGYTLTDANGINNAGQIAATAIIPSGQTHAVLLAPTVVTQSVNRVPTSTLTTLPSGNLLVFDPRQNAFVPTSSVAGTTGYVDPSLPTVVLTHGFNSSSTMWGGQNGFASALYSSAGVKENILAWDWSSAAGSLSHPSTLITATYASQNEGQLLAPALVSALGANYTGTIHFVGHSLGTLVNAQAIDGLSTLDTSAVITDTLFDDAEKANILAGSQFSAIPNKGTTIWIDNYISAFGEAHQGAVNVLLYQGATILDPIDFHSYPPSWYQQTIGSTSASLNGMGFQFNGSQVQAGVDPYNFLQSVNFADPLDLTPTTYADLQTKIAARNVLEAGTGTLNTIGQLTIYGINGAIQTAGNVLVNVVTLPPDSFDNSTPMFGPQIQLGKVSSPTSMIALQHGASGAPGTITSGSAATPTANSSYAWVAITIPSNAQTMSFDFIFHGLSPQDALSVGINDMQLLAIESQFLDEGAVNNSGYIDVSEWSGQDVTLFLGLLASPYPSEVFRG